MIESINEVNEEVLEQEQTKQQEQNNVYVSVNDDIRIMLEPDNTKVLQLKHTKISGKNTGETVWKDSGYFTKWDKLLMYLLNEAVNAKVRKISKESNTTIITLKELKQIILEQNQEITNWFNMNMNGDII